MDKKRWAWRFAALLALLSVGSTGFALPSSASSRAGATPPRLSWLSGDVSSWRPGDEAWAPARINWPLAPGDALYSGRNGRIELQFGARSYLRADAGTQVALDNQEPDYIVFKVTSGRVSLDIRRIPVGDTIEVDSPRGALTIESPGYYRLEVSNDATHFLTRRGGHARMTPPAGEVVDMASNQETVVDASNGGAAQVYAAPGVDEWDRWSYARTDQLLEASSTQYVGDVYGAADLDQYGRWESAPDYGRVWVPQVEASWVPYSTGSWTWDSYYGWTWVDTAPWGWAPFHYGRWVYFNRYWAWAPGPFVAAPIYSPALVTFFGGSGFRVGIGIGIPSISWVALGWGEPCLPWWGGVGFIGHPWWGGWGGPHIIDHHIVNNTNINITNVNVFEHVHDHRGVVAVPSDRFGHDPVERTRLANVENVRLAPVHELLPRQPDRPSRLPEGNRQDPRNAALTREVVSAEPSSAHSRGAPRPAPDQTRGTRTTSIAPANNAPIAPESRREVREPYQQPPRHFEEQTRGAAHPFEANRQPSTASPLTRGRELSGSGTTRVAPSVPDGLERRAPHVERSAPRSNEPLRFDQESLERRAPGASNGGSAAPGRFSVIERQPQHVESPNPREALHRYEPPAAPSGGVRGYEAPEQRLGREPMPRQPAAAAPAAPILREAPAPAPRMEAPRFQPRMEQHQAMPQHFERAAPMHVPNAAPAGNQGGGSTSGGGSHSRGGPHGR
ncbi:MAG: hypothetical protein HY270_16790 [Deltaproteobacteria bacterium]|nr:hypothetical protein [Deltaproteobacteria bacterium]